MSNTVKACPECNTTHIRHRNPEQARSPAEGDEAYRCKECSHRFDDPKEREKRQEQTLRGLPGILERMDKDTLGKPK